MCHQYGKGNEMQPNQVKFRLMTTVRPALTDEGDLVYNVFQQRMGRIWAPHAVLSGEIPADGQANFGMDIEADLVHGWSRKRILPPLPGARPPGAE